MWEVDPPCKIAYNEQVSIILQGGMTIWYKMIPLKRFDYHGNLVLYFLALLFNQVIALVHGRRQMLLLASLLVNPIVILVWRKLIPNYECNISLYLLFCSESKISYDNY